MVVTDLTPLSARPLYQADSTRATAYQAWALSRSRSLLDLDQLDEALAAARWGRAAAVDAAAWSTIAECQVAVGSALDARGDLDGAVTEYRGAIELGDEPGTEWALAARGALASIAIRRDHLDEAAELLAEVRCTGHQNPVPLLVRAEAELFESRGQRAEALSRLAVDPDVAGSDPQFAPAAVRLAVSEGRPELALAVTEAASRAAGRLESPSSVAAALRCHGIVHDDSDAFVRAAEVASSSPRPLVRAGAHEDAGLALATAGRLDEARRHFAAALETFDQLGAVRDVGRVAAVSRACGIRHGQRGRRRRPAHGWDSLTATERRVAGLVASGLSNPAIGERMFLSRRTVQSHVSHILTKTGLTSRVELAAAIASGQRELSNRALSATWPMFRYR